MESTTGRLVSGAIIVTKEKTVGSPQLRGQVQITKQFLSILKKPPPEMGISEDGVPDQPTGLLLDAYISHFDKRVKAVTEPMKKLYWLLMDGGTTPKGQPLDVLINKVLRG